MAYNTEIASFISTTLTKRFDVVYLLAIPFLNQSLFNCHPAGLVSSNPLGNLIRFAFIFIFLFIISYIIRAARHFVFPLGLHQ